MREFHMRREKYSRRREKRLCAGQRVTQRVSQQLWRWAWARLGCRFICLGGSFVSRIAACDAAAHSVNVTMVFLLRRWRRRGRGWAGVGRVGHLGRLTGWRRLRGRTCSAGNAVRDFQLPARILVIELKLPRRPQSRALLELEEDGNVKGSPT